MRASAAPTPANRLGLDYRAEAARLGAPIAPIIDAHAHVGGAVACRIHLEAARLYGVRRTYSMTQLAQAPAVRDALGDEVRFIAIPSWSDPDRSRTMREAYLEAIERFHADFGSRMLKIWSSPRLRDFVPDGATDLWEIDSPWRVRACELAERLGMMVMVHVADPDTWFATRYADRALYGAKRDHYTGLERMLDRFTMPWIAAHFGGWPEDLAFIDGLLSRHPNLHIDVSATKWMVREVSRHEPGTVRAFMARWPGRVLFGTDIVSSDDHLQPAKAGQSPIADLADSPEAAFDLYASRFWALRTLWETSYDHESPIADPDLALVEPGRYDHMSAPRLRAVHLPPADLRMLYAGAAEQLIERWWSTH